MLVLLSFLLVNAVACANPFMGRWTADEITVVADETTMTVTVDSDNPVLLSMEGVYAYTFDGEVLRAGDLVALYEFAPDESQAIILCIFDKLGFSMHFTKMPFQTQDSSYNS
jgi:hypothetical protein